MPPPDAFPQPGSEQPQPVPPPDNSPLKFAFGVDRDHARRVRVKKGLKVGGIRTTIGADVDVRNATWLPWWQLETTVPGGAELSVNSTAVNVSREWGVKVGLAHAKLQAKVRCTYDSKAVLSVDILPQFFPVRLLGALSTTIASGNKMELCPGITIPGPRQIRAEVPMEVSKDPPHGSGGTVSFNVRALNATVSL
mmetsp:Transcript_10143/g.35311  ORF Transcript_10143/g.35311 Transcript_10143/m.35311 type:complete len:195 (-) Transcript_10143:92-676(-)